MACQEEVNQHESKEKVQILRCEMMGRWEDGKMVSWCVTSKSLLLDRSIFDLKF